MMGRIASLLSPLLLLVASCGADVGATDRDPDVAVSKIVGPLALTGQQSGGSAVPDDQAGVVDLLDPRDGPALVPATTAFNPITGATAENPLQVYVTASDELGVVEVELFYNGTSVGTRTKAGDGIAFKNPFVFPNPQNGLPSIPITGTPSGLTEGQLSAAAVDNAGKVAQSRTVELAIDGSLPGIDVAVTGNETPGPVTISAQASDPETGILELSFTCDALPLPASEDAEGVTDLECPETATSTTSASAATTTPGIYTYTFSATNGARAVNATFASFTVTEPVEPIPENTAPTVTLTPSPALGPAPLTVNFAAEAEDAEGDTLSYSWNFGDGATAPNGEATQNHTYTTAGTYTATVTVSDGNGGTTSAEAVITVEGDDDGGSDDGGTDDGGTTTGGSTSGTTTDGTTTGTTTGGTTTGGTTGTTTGTTSSGTTTGSTTGTTTGGTTGGTTTGGTTTGGTDDGGSGTAPTVTIYGDGSRTVDPGGTVSLTATATDPNNETITYAWTASPSTDVTFSAAGQGTTNVTFSSSASGVYTITVTATNASGEQDTDQVSVTVSSDNGGGNGDDNGGVDAVDDTKSTTRNQAVTINVLANDKPGANALTIIAATSPRQGGEVEISRERKSVTYTPLRGSTGTDTFSYTVQDEDGNRDRAQVRVNVRAP